MKVGDLRQSATARGHRLSAVIEARGKSDEVWFEWNGPACPCPEDVFLLLTILPAMSAREDLHLAGPVSERLAKALPRIEEIYGGWLPDLRDFRLESERGTVRRRRRWFGATASSFTGGVDSFYTVLNRRPRILAYAHGYDLRLGQTDLRAMVTTALRGSSERLGRRLVQFESNLRDWSEGFAPWFIYHGAAVAALGVLLSAEVSTFYIPSSYPAGTRCGSSSVIDPLFSTEAVRFIHDRPEVVRADKLAAIARDRDAQETLRVCWENRDGNYNCSRCEKCLRTTVALEALGVLPKFVTFALPPDPARIRALSIGEEANRLLWRANLELCRRRKVRPELVDAIEALLGEKRE